MSGDELNNLEIEVLALRGEVQSLRMKLNDARRTICLDRCARYSMPDHETWEREAMLLAKSKGWDCFDE